MARLGSLDGPGALSQAFSLQVTPAGRVLVGEPTYPGIVVFNASGEFERILGRRGEGPGEFTVVGWLGWRADTLYALDWGRVHFYTPGLEHLSTHRIAVQSPPERNVSLVIPGPLTDGGHVIGITEPTPGAEANTDLHLPLFLLERSGTIAGVVTRLRTGIRGVRVQVEADERPVRVTNPWRDDDLWTISANGSSILVATRRIAPEPADEGRFSVTGMNMNGDTIFQRTFSFAIQELSDDEYGDTIRAIATRLSSTRDVSAAVVDRRLRSELPAPTSKPPLTAIVPGRDGTIWLRQQPEGASALWLVLDSAGAMLGSVALPANLRVLQAERGRVWGVIRGELDVPFVEIWDVGT